MCAAAAIPVLKFIAPMVLPSLAQRIFGGKQQSAKPANFNQTAAPGTKLAQQAQAAGEDEEAKDETKAAETEASKNQKLMRERKKNPNLTTGAVGAPESSGLGSNIGGTNQQTGGINTGIPSATYA